MTTTTEYKVIGKRPVRHDGIEKVTGAARYGADIQLPGMLHGKILRSPHAHARIKSIDTSKAEAHPGVRAVATCADFVQADPIGREITYPQVVGENLLARDKALYAGHPVAAVAGTSPHDAEEALSLIEVEYEVLPPVFDVEEAMKPDAPVLHEHWPPAEDGSESPNIATHQQNQFGDLEKGFAEADLVVEREYRTKTVHQGYIEPQNATASWAPNGRLTVWCSSQGHFTIRDQTAEILGIPTSDVKVVPMEIGGGFGGKLSVYLEPVAAVLSKKSGKPVRMTMTRAEVLEATGPTCGSYTKVKIGVTKEGVITAAHASFYFEAGAYPGAPLAAATAGIFAPYDIENLQVDGYDVVDNKPKTSAYRAPGVPNITFPIEALMDEVAEELEMDPMDLRLANVAVEGSRRADGAKHRRIGAKEVMEAVKEHPHFKAPLEGKNRGRGVSMGFCRNNTGMAAAVVSILPDGKVSLVEGSPDIGGSRVALAQQLAEVLGISVEDVIPQVADTDSVGYTSPTGGSSVAFKTGLAAHDAGMDVRDQLIKRAARAWEVEEDQVEYVDGTLQHKSDPELKLSFREIAGMLPRTGGPVVGSATVFPMGVGSSYAANIIDVEVDEETGKVDILRCTAFQDVGKAIHPDYVEGQIQGGAAQGVGWALSEEYFMGEDGQLLNSSLLDYRMPTSVDLPMIESVILEVPNPGHPFGVRGAGEANIAPPLGAVANAIYDAVGVRMRSLPMNPGAIVEALKAKNGSG